MGCEEIWQGVLPAELQPALVEIRRRAEKLTDPPLLPHFTDHSVKHFDKVAEYFVRLILPIQASKHALSDHEVFIGLSACYLHDVALQSDHALLPDKHVGEYGPDDLNAVRKAHPRLAAEWIRNGLQADRRPIDGERTPNLGVTYDETTRSLAPYIAKLCEHHSGPIPTQDLAIPPSHAGRPIRLLLLLHLLRLADALDLDERRIRMDNLTRWSISPESLAHWWRHHYVTSVEVDHNCTISITMTFPPGLSAPYIVYFAEAVYAELDREIRPAQLLFRANCLFPHLMPIKTTQDYGEARQPLPPALKDYIGKKAASGESERVATPTSLKYGKSWISFWGFSGNPWTDLPVSMADEEFINTADLKSKADELEQLFVGKKGALKILYGARGSGKTTFLSTIRERFGKVGPVSYQDLSVHRAPGTRVSELGNVLFPRIIRDLAPGTKDHTDVFPDDIQAALAHHKLAKPVILIDNLDRYSEDPDLALVKRFFEVSQGHLQAMKTRAIVVISANESWKPVLKIRDLNYLGRASEWDMAPFTADEAEELIKNRLRLSGIKRSEMVFEKGAIDRIHWLAGGNPREILTICSVLCEKAARAGVRPISGDYVKKEFNKEFLGRIADAIMQVTVAEPIHLSALERLYGFYLGIERSDVAPDDIWEIFLRLLAGEAIAPLSLLETRHLLAHVADKTLLTHEKAGPGVSVRPVIRHFIDSLSQRGVSAKEFVEFYKLRPIPPDRVPRTVLMEALYKRDSTDPIRVAVSHADALLEAIGSGKHLPLAVAMKARFVIEHLLAAYLLAHDEALPDFYILDHDEGRFVVRERSRSKTPAQVRKDLSELVDRVSRGRRPLIKSLREIELIQRKTDDYLTEMRPEISRPDASLLVQASNKVADELFLLIYRRLASAD